jgi:hypothetical protein
MALGTSTFDFAAGAVSDLFAAEAHRMRAQGAELEEQEYLLAAGMADKNAQYTAMSTRIKAGQADRNLYKSLGQTTADIAGAGFATSGSALDILRESASQGALAKAVLTEQGLITQEGYKEQAQSYRIMSFGAQIAAEAERTAATGAEITGAIKGAAAIGTLFI